MFRFRLRYFILAAILFSTEILIAVYAHDQFIRPILGDVLVVMLIYFFIRAFFNVPVYTTAIAVLLFAYCVEVSQYFKLIRILGLQSSRIATTVLGTAFAWQDIVAYTVGIAVVLMLEQYLTAHQ